MSSTNLSEQTSLKTTANTEQTQTTKQVIIPVTIQKTEPESKISSENIQTTNPETQTKKETETTIQMPKMVENTTEPEPEPEIITTQTTDSTENNTINNKLANLSSIAIELGEINEDEINNEITSEITLPATQLSNNNSNQPRSRSVSSVGILSTPISTNIFNNTPTLTMEAIPSNTMTIEISENDTIHGTSKKNRKKNKLRDNIPFPDSIYQYLYVLKGRKSSSACLDRIIALGVLFTQIGGYLAIALYAMQNRENNDNINVNNNVNNTPAPTVNGFQNSYYKYYVGYVQQTSQPTIFTLLYVAYIVMMFLFPDICIAFYLLFTQRCCVCRSLWNRVATWLIFCTSLLAVGCVIISISFQSGDLSLFNMLSTGIGVIFISDIDDKILPVFKKNKGFGKRLIFVTFFCGFTALTTFCISYFQRSSI